MAGCSKDIASSTTTLRASFSTGASALSDGHDYDTESEDENDQERRAVVSLLDRLKAVSAADIARSRKTKRNEPAKGNAKVPCYLTQERVFSLLKASFGEPQDMALQDYVEASMLQYNKR